MSKELPWFKFYPSEWLIGKISFQPLEIQGAFIQCVCIFWQNNGNMQRSDIDFRIGNDKLEALISNGFIVEDDKGLSIKFLDEQILSFSEISEKRKIAGQQGGLAKAKRSKPIKSSTKKSPSKPFIPPTLSEVISYFSENGYSADHAHKAFHYYNDADWKDSKGNRVINWKQKFRGNWFKEENKQSKQIAAHNFVPPN